jgi:hypothetical protein
MASLLWLQTAQTSAVPRDCLQVFRMGTTDNAKLGIDASVQAANVAPASKAGPLRIRAAAARGLGGRCSMLWSVSLHSINAARANALEAAPPAMAAVVEGKCLDKVGPLL